MDKHDNQDNVTSQGDARRKFIRGVGTGIVLASLPARSVWATGGNNASVMGSMSTSSAMNTESLCLRSHGYFKNHYNSFSKSYDRYEDCFGGKPLHNDASKIKLITEESSNWRGEYKPCLADVVQCEGDGQDGVAMELDDGRIIPDKQVNPTYVGVNA
jgi:hypothetical protein